MKLGFDCMAAFGAVTMHLTWHGWWLEVEQRGQLAPHRGEVWEGLRMSLSPEVKNMDFK